ncbi:MAG: aminomethyl-transferring glycine dehydrogenase [Rhodobacteraceae bacterium]|nr:aminomethyl-transferring glycine dehydrogenase [Paracoccaceae bacterium]
MAFTPVNYNPDDFANLRHIGPTREGVESMLSAMGYESEEALIEALLPASLNRASASDLGKPMTELEVLAHMREVASRNKSCISLIGMGYHRTVTPPAIQRNIIENPAWYTAYTPYQPEISQGRLEILLAFQTMICDLTGLDVANASLLDEATAAAEAMAMAKRVAKSKSDLFFVDSGCHPQILAVLRTRAKPLGLELLVGDPCSALVPGEVFGALFQYPNTYGAANEFSQTVAALHESRAVAVASADPLALALLKEPGAMGVDIAVGTTQRFGMPLGYGGPHAGYIACRSGLMRDLPGRIVGVSVDSRGNPALRLALQTREQHIRRQRAKSNICTAQVLPAVVAGFFAVFHGRAGIRAIAERVHLHTVALKDALLRGGWKVIDSDFFDTITVEAGADQMSVMQAARDLGINLRPATKGRIVIALDELVDSETLSSVCHAFGCEFSQDHSTDTSPLPDNLLRKSDFMQNPVFHMNRSETGLMRYLRRLADKDLALDRTMIPLGSCTMKLNAAAEMMPITWPEFGQIHPFAPADQAEGYSALIRDLSDRLCAITGFAAISMQPNSGAQGEYAGLLTIKAYHEDRGEHGRNVCLIPKSAHGTNAASAQLAGMKVVEIATSSDGTIDLDDLRHQAGELRAELAATMITYPSTHGVFEDTIREVIDITHDHGGQVYLDGANLNALVGIAKPGELEADVSHLNLHKTFCIPHGGGGPGMGPIGVREHLIPFLPGDPVSENPASAVSATAFGSPSILPVSWAYILMMGWEGLARATRIAIINANYIAHRLREKYEICYSGQAGLVAHECIIDVRSAVEGTAVTVDDVAKRLIDNGFHPPTMSWPVMGTLMVEPTESESKEELDRFCDAMLQIHDEIDEIRQGRIDADCNPLKNAPHTIEDIIGDWQRPYSRDIAAFPAGCRRDAKFWPPVNRVDNVWGDRNFVGRLPD